MLRTIIYKQRDLQQSHSQVTVADPGTEFGRGTFRLASMAIAEREPITGVWGCAPIQGHSPWSEGQGVKPP